MTDRTFFVGGGTIAEMQMVRGKGVTKPGDGRGRRRRSRAEADDILLDKKLKDVTA